MKQRLCSVLKSIIKLPAAIPFKRIGGRLYEIIIPHRGDDKGSLVRKAIIILLLICAAVCITLLGIIAGRHGNNRKKYSEIQSVMNNILKQQENEDGGLDFSALYERNSDIKAWISIPDTSVNYPICQYSDNDYYLHHNFDLKKSEFGTLFFDYTNTVSGENASQNLTVYGHSMSNDQMFTSLLKYHKLSFYKAHPYITLITPERQMQYKIFAVMVAAAKPEDDNGNFYDFTKCDFAKQRDFLSWADEARERSIFNLNVDVLPDDRVLTLSTCDYVFDNCRLVIMARRQRIGEESGIDTETAVNNPNPRYPKAWYDKRKKAYPFG